MSDTPTLDDIRAAAERIAPFVHRTPVLTSSSINRITGCEITFKCENFQKGGAFKIRGATNAIRCLSEDQIRYGVATHSSGNHAAAVALAAKMRNTTAYTVMPSNVSRVKKEAVAGYGAKITYCEPTLSARDSVLNDIVRDTGAAFIHPYDNRLVIEGQATTALELLEEVPGLDVVMAPIGGGGLISGTALAVRGLSPRTKVIGVEPEGADDAYRSFRSGTLISAAGPSSIADGLLASLSERTFNILSRHVNDVVTVDDDTITDAMRTIWERMKLVVEPSAAVPFAAILSGRVNITGLKVGIILTGGNVDLNRLPWMNVT
ncbi:MAG: pyridoxal-phosphate dependent enzyme [Arenicellales bacterium]|nr:pyridoxal-phosphate dependent enzyme [Arenicellales bacterium]